MLIIMSYINVVNGNFKNFINDKDLIIEEDNNLNPFEIGFSCNNELNVDYLNIGVPKFNKYKDKDEAINMLIFCYEKVLLEAMRNNYNNVLIIALGINNNYIYDEIEKLIIERLDSLSKIYNMKISLLK